MLPKLFPVCIQKRKGGGNDPLLSDFQYNPRLSVKENRSNTVVQEKNCENKIYNIFPNILLNISGRGLTPKQLLFTMLLHQYQF